MHSFIEYIHFLGIMVLMGALIAKYLIALLKITNESIRFLSIANSMFIVSLLIVLASGLFRWFLFGKGFDYYMTNPFFHTKLTLFLLLLVLAFFPYRKINNWNRKFMKNKSFQVADKEVKSLFLFFRIEAVLIVVIPLLAVLVKMGIGV